MNDQEVALSVALYALKIIAQRTQHEKVPKKRPPGSHKTVHEIARDALDEISVVNKGGDSKSSDHAKE